MKKITLVLLFACASTVYASAEGVSKVIESLTQSAFFENPMEAEADDESSKEAKAAMAEAMGATSFAIHTLKEDCSDEDRQKTIEQLSIMEDDDAYETIMHVNEGSDSVRIFRGTNGTDEDQMEILLVVMEDEGDGDIVIIRVCGKKEMMEALMNGINFDN